MYKELKTQLENAEAESQFIIAINIDIRGFTNFCRSSNTAEVALFIQNTYLKIINEYFSDITFCKPTGDGMMIVVPYNKNNFIDLMKKTIISCNKLFNNFSLFFDDDPNIYFTVPKGIGIGISRGSACCIKSNDIIIDYSGQVLNIASRLMDIARPQGIVIHNNFDINILNEDLKNQFLEDILYVRGVAEIEPINVYYLKNIVEIELLNKNPIGIYEWKENHRTMKYSDLSPFATRYSVDLDDTPYSESSIKVIIEYPDIFAGGGNMYIELSKKDYNLRQIGNEYKIAINMDTIKDLLKNKQISEKDDILTRIIYPVRIKKQ